MAEAEPVRRFKRPGSEPGLAPSPTRTGLLARRESRLKAAPVVTSHESILL